jgi:acyl-CoA synthetase (NDP forming)
MSIPIDGSPVPDEHRVLRLPLPPKDFTPDGWKPTHQELEPSSSDKRYASEHGRPIRVSVWDAAITTTEQARAFRGRPVIVIAALVANVRAAGATAVVYDNLAPPDSEKPGAAGHAGIEGLDRAADEPKTVWRTRLQKIADAFALEFTA